MGSARTMDCTAAPHATASSQLRGAQRPSAAVPPPRRRGRPHAARRPLAVSQDPPERAVAAASATSGAVGSGRGGAAVPAGALAFREVTREDYWVVADMHCCAFYPRARPFWAGLLRLDRVMALELGRERQGVSGQFECLVAEAAPGSDTTTFTDTHAGSSAAGQPPATAATAPLVSLLVRWVLPPAMQQRHGTAHQAAGVLGAVVVDSWAEHLPRRRVSANGAVRQVRRRGIAYLSNLAVSPAAQRRGVGAALLSAAEQLAAGWGCRAMALHVDPGNAAAVALYEGAGYRQVALQSKWEALMEGRSAPLALMLRRLPRARRRPADGAGGEGAG